MKSTIKRIVPGFTIVELLVVIVIIGILASITIVSYTGITQKATVATLQADLSNSSNQLKMYQATYGSYPTSLDASNCPLLPTADTTLCLKASSTNTFSYTPSATSFYLAETSSNGTVYTVTDNQSPQPKVSLAVSDSTNWLAVGTQVWAKANLNVGTMIAGVINQTNNATLEKYCYSDDNANCTTYGGLYQWNEAMQYINTAGAQGICLIGSHIPTDNDWKILEVQLGMTQVQADTNGWRGTDQGAKLKPSGSSGLNVPLAGYRLADGSFGFLSSGGSLWSSLESSTSVWYRYLYSSVATVDRNTEVKSSGFSIRCIGN